MIWTRIGLEPCEAALPKRGGPWCVYGLALPLISDGRIAVAQMLKDPAQARATRFGPDGERLDGRIQLLEGQWSMAWDSVPRVHAPDVRFFGRRYLPGDQVGLRPGNSVLLVYRVCDSQRMGQWLAAAGA